MSAWMKFYGTINVDPNREGFHSLLAALVEDSWEGPEAISFEEAGDQVHIDIDNTMSHSRMELIEEGIKEFAEKYAKEPAQIFTQYEDEETEHFFVGPPGFDPVPLDIEYKRGLVAGLEKEIAKLGGSVATRHEMDHRELSTVLAALRYWQRLGTQDKGHPEDDIATDGDSIQPLTVAEIDDLCERINC